MKKKLKQIFLDIKNDQIAEEFSGIFCSTFFLIFKKLFQSNSLIYFRTRDLALSNKKKDQGATKFNRRVKSKTKLMQNFCPTPLCSEIQSTISFLSLEILILLQIVYLFESKRLKKYQFGHAGHLIILKQTMDSKDIVDLKYFLIYAQSAFIKTDFFTHIL